MDKQDDIFYHGSHILFDEFDLSHALEGDGKVKFGYGVYVTSSYNSAAHYSGADPDAWGVKFREGQFVGRIYWDVCSWNFVTTAALSIPCRMMP